MTVWKQVRDGESGETKAWVEKGGVARELGEATRGVRGESEERGVRQNETQEVN